MILFTGRGDLFSTFNKKYPSGVVSVRNLTDNELKAHFRQTEVLIHNAADLACADLKTAVENNFLLTKRVADLLFEVNANAKMINIASMSFLENENDYKNIDNMSLYAYSKYLAETYCLQLNSKQIVSVRFSTLFYQNPAKDGLSKLIHDAVDFNKITLINDGTAYRNFIPLEVAADYLFQIANSPFEKLDNKINLVSDKKHNFKQIAVFLQTLEPDLVIENKNLEHIIDVLCDFSIEKLTYLNIHHFDLEKYIKDYFSKLKNKQ